VEYTVGLRKQLRPALQTTVLDARKQGDTDDLKQKHSSNNTNEKQKKKNFTLHITVPINRTRDAPMRKPADEPGLNVVL